MSLAKLCTVVNIRKHWTIKLMLQDVFLASTRGQLAVHISHSAEYSVSHSRHRNDLLCVE